MPHTLSPNPGSLIGGVQAGYNWQSGKFVLGVEADIQGADVTGDARRSPIIQNHNTPFPGGLPHSPPAARLVWYRAAARRLHPDRPPVALRDRGVAFGDVDYSAQADFIPVGTELYSAAFSSTKVGWTIGAAPSGHLRRTGARSLSISTSTSETNPRFPIRCRRCLHSRSDTAGKPRSKLPASA